MFKKKKKKKKTGCCWSAAEMTFQITLEVDAISFSKITAIDARAGRRRTDLVEVRRGDLPSRQLHSLHGHVLNISLSKDIRQCCLTRVLLQLCHKEIRIMNLYNKKNNASFHRRILFSYRGVKQVHFFQNLSERMWRAQKRISAHLEKACYTKKPAT